MIDIHVPAKERSLQASFAGNVKSILDILPVCPCSGGRSDVTAAAIVARRWYRLHYCRYDTRRVADLHPHSETGTS